MRADGTLLLQRSDVARLLTLPDCLRAVEEMFRLQGEGKLPAPGVLGLKSARGGLHVKAALLPGERSYIVAKLNTNFPGNPAGHDLPTIQGLIALFDADNGAPLAVLDSIDITIKRTAAASAVAAKYLARPGSSVATICGCGQQAAAQLRALRAVLPVEKVYTFDCDPAVAERFAAQLRDEPGIQIESTDNLSFALRESDICVTCTTATEFFVRREDVRPGTFIAAVGADDSHKQEIDPSLIASAKVIADNLEQCCAIGDTHHAIAQGVMEKDDVYAELSEIVAGRKPGRTSDTEIIIFDSTGIALEDAVATIAVYESARESGAGKHFDFAV